MSAPLAFGTAGLRGPLRAGPAGMNLAVVRRAAAGIAAYLRGNGQPGRTVVVGYDGRHRSAEFAADAAGVLAAAGFSVLLAPGPLPTPITAFAVRQLDAAAGVQVTASHNPPQDNGLKVYLAQGAQLVSPEDSRIEAAIAAARPAAVDRRGRRRHQPGRTDMVQGYLDRAASLARSARAKSPRFGWQSPRCTASAAKPLSRHCIWPASPTCTWSTEQAAPDADFPTVPFPNPEEPGATDLLLALAERVGADLAIAMDPDADRCAFGVPLPGGGWRMLSGDETGVADRRPPAAHPGPRRASGSVGGHHHRLRRAAAADRRGPRRPLCRDPDRLQVDRPGRRRRRHRAGLRVRGGARALRRPGSRSGTRTASPPRSSPRTWWPPCRPPGQTLLDRLDELARAHGLRRHRPALGAGGRSGADRRRRWPGCGASPPTTLLGEPVTEVTDLLPRTDGDRLRTARVRVVVRPSGTEPKLKCYLQVTAPVPAGADLAGLRETAAAEIAALTTEIGSSIGLTG